MQNNSLITQIKLYNRVDVIYHDTTKLQYLLNTDEAISLTGTRKVHMIKQIIENNAIKLDFFMYSAEVKAFGTTTYSFTETLEEAEFNVEMHTESSSSNVLISTGSWYATYLSKYKSWFVGRVLETYTNEIKVICCNSIHKMLINSVAEKLKIFL